MIRYPKQVTPVYTTTCKPGRESERVPCAIG